MAGKWSTNARLSGRAVGAASQIPREFTTEKSGKRDPFRDLNPGMLATVNWLVFHGSLGSDHGTSELD